MYNYKIIKKNIFLTILQIVYEMNGEIGVNIPKLNCNNNDTMNTGFLPYMSEKCPKMKLPMKTPAIKNESADARQNELSQTKENDFTAEL